MNLEEIEKILKEIRSREDYLLMLRIQKDYQFFLFSLNYKEKEYLKNSCIEEIKRLRKSIECLTD